MSVEPKANRSFFQRSNDPSCRSFTCRAARFLRARLRGLAAGALEFADDPRVLQAWRKGWDSAHYLRLLRWHEAGFHPAVIYDIGAHEGAWSEMCQSIFEPAKLLLFEPQGSYLAKAMARAPSNSNWQGAQVALGEKRQTATIHLTRNPAASSLLAPIEGALSQTDVIQEVRGEPVEVMPLDDVVSSRELPWPDLVKIDVQGFEGRVIKGGKETFQRAGRVIVEVSLESLYTGQPLLPEVLERLVDHGFKLDDIHETYRAWPGRLWQVDLWFRRAD
jgi:FkbM family methyltransferase